MQGKTNIPKTQTPITARMETPTKEWPDILEDIIKEQLGDTDQRTDTDY